MLLVSYPGCFQEGLNGLGITGAFTCTWNSVKLIFGYSKHVVLSVWCNNPESYNGKHAYSAPNKGYHSMESIWAYMNSQVFLRMRHVSTVVPGHLSPPGNGLGTRVGCDMTFSTTPSLSGMILSLSSPTPDFLVWFSLSYFSCSCLTPFQLLTKHRDCLLCFLFFALFSWALHL